MNRYARLLTACVICILAPQAVLAADAAPEAAAPAKVEAKLIGLDGADMGMVMLQDTPSGVLVTTHAMGLTEGEHGFHFHEKGICDPVTKFASAGGHFAAGGAMHGLMMMGGPHGGDMPNQHVGADGMLMGQVFNTGVTLTPGAKSLDDADGAALVIHGAADDYISQPAGNAGPRIACAVIYPPKP